MTTDARGLAALTAEWSSALLADWCPVCHWGPYSRVMGHLAEAHGIPSAQVRVAAGWPTIERERSHRVRENWHRLGSHLRAWKLRGLMADRLDSARRSESARGMMARRPDEVKAAAALRMNTHRSARLRWMWAAMAPEERRLRTAPARAASDGGITAPGRYALLPAEVRSRIGRAGQKAQAALRRRAAERRRLIREIDRIETGARREERDLTRKERAELAGLMRQWALVSRPEPVPESRP